MIQGRCRLEEADSGQSRVAHLAIGEDGQKNQARDF
jgi:hypothetical protein